MNTVRLVSGVSFSVENNETILEAARKHKIVLEHSCRTGRCGVCKAVVNFGETKALQNEEGLSSNDSNLGWILTCVRTPISDVELNVEDLGRLASIDTKTLPCRIESLEHLAPDVLRVILRLPPTANFLYVSGQYINVIVNGIRRSYSIANAPRYDGRVELHIRAVQNGVMSNYWFTQAAVNDLLRFEGPLGTFSFRDKPIKNVVFLATGTGIAPVKAILEELLLHPEWLLNKSIYVYWGGRIVDDLYWDVKDISCEVNYRPVLSKVNDTWQGRFGYIQDAILADGISLNDSVVYACGSDAMIHSARSLLIANGLLANNFYSDAFVSSN